MNDSAAHYARTETVDAVARVFFGDEPLLESERAVRLTEYTQGRRLDPVIYFPAAALAGLDTRSSARVTHCPIKGEAGYLDFRDVADAIWCYREPLPGVAAIAGHVAFDPGKGFRVEIDPA